MTMLDSAIEYRHMGFSVFPCKIDKRPILETWKPYQNKLASAEQIKEWWTSRPKAAIAIATGKLSGIVVVDVDDMDVGTKEIGKYFPTDIDTPTVRTPSGGMHYIFKHPGIEVTNKAGAIPGTDFRGDGGYVIAPPSFCSYDKKGKHIEGPYEWIKDLSTPMAELPKEYIIALDLYLRTHGVTDETTNVYSMSTSVYTGLQTSTKLFVEGRRDEDLFHVANSLIKGGCNPVIARYTLDILAHTCNPPFPEKDIQTKLNSAMERARHRERNIAEEVREYILSTNGNFLSTEVAKCLQLSTRDELKNLSIILKRELTAGVIERYGTRNGSWRRVEVEYTPMDLDKADGNPISGFSYPLGIEAHAKTYPKNVIIFCGIQNKGKSAFAFETARMNRKLFPDSKVRFMSSEAADNEIKERLLFYPQQYETMKYDWWNKNVDFIERHDTWWDIVDPDGLNIIDYVSDYVESYKIPHYINEVHKKLRKGVAIVVLQRDPNKPNSNGGQATKHASRLYVDIEWGKITLTKVKGAIKHPPEYKHPDGLMRNFDIEKVWKIVPKGDWYWTEEKTKYGDLTRKPKQNEEPKQVVEVAEDDEGGWFE